MSEWLLQKLTIEGLRGINNEGDPLVLDFNTDAVNSIFAPNAVGKSSIYDALSFAIRGNIKKLDALPSAEKAREYYKNRFHSTGLGFAELELVSNTGQLATVRCALDGAGQRVVSSANYPDPEALLSSINREFALLDYATFQRFVEAKPTDRGRSFAGLLGLDADSKARQRLALRPSQAQR
jgi:DNA repair exonuclease SbcCD ATPase subunit